MTQPAWGAATCPAHTRDAPFRVYTIRHAGFTQPPCAGGADLCASSYSILGGLTNDVFTFNDIGPPGATTLSSILSMSVFGTGCAGFADIRCIPMECRWCSTMQRLSSNIAQGVSTECVCGRTASTRRDVAVAENASAQSYVVRGVNTLGTQLRLHSTACS